MFPHNRIWVSLSYVKSSQTFFYGICWSSMFIWVPYPNFSRFILERRTRIDRNEISLYVAFGFCYFYDSFFFFISLNYMADILKLNRNGILCFYMTNGSMSHEHRKKPTQKRFEWANQREEAELLFGDNSI